MTSDAAAETYKWVDEKGVTHYSDTLPPGYSRNANTQIDKRGMIKKKTERALTEAEIKVKQQEIQRLKAEEIKVKEQKRLDDVMLATYATESEVDLVRDRSLEPYDGKIYLARERIKLLQQQLVDQNKQLALFMGTTASGKKRTPPARLTKEVVATNKEISTLENSIKDLENDKARIVAKFADDKRRFREVKAAGGAGMRVDEVAARGNIPTWVEVRSPLARDCLANWQATLGGRAYAVFAEIKRDRDYAELLLETRVRKVTGEFVNIKASCPLNTDGSFNLDGVRVKRQRYELGKDY